MKLKTQVLIIANFEGKTINVEGRDVALKLNGVQLETRLPDVFSELEFDDDEISGNSLLSYYKVMEDGSLEVKGSKIQLVDVAKNELILIKKIKRSSIHDDENMPVELIKKFIEFFNVEDPESVFTDLNAEEKQSIIADKKTQATGQDMQKEAQEAAQKSAQEEADLKASIDPKFVVENNAYASHQSFYRGIGFKESIKDQYHLFYGKDDNESPNVLIKRGDAWWQEVEEVIIDDENDKTVAVSFPDGSITKKITLDIASGEITITELAAAE